jgi:hypothetical protein
MFPAQVTKPTLCRNALISKLQQTQKNLKQATELNRKVLQDESVYQFQQCQEI